MQCKLYIKIKIPRNNKTNSYIKVLSYINYIFDAITRVEPPNSPLTVYVSCIFFVFFMGVRFKMEVFYFVSPPLFCLGFHIVLLTFSCQLLYLSEIELQMTDSRHLF